jgi:hypothetical protein
VARKQLKVARKQLKVARKQLKVARKQLKVARLQLKVARLLLKVARLETLQFQVLATPLRTRQVARLQETEFHSDWQCSLWVLYFSDFDVGEVLSKLRVA